MVLSRFFAIVWTLAGLVIIAILTGKVATVLTDFGYVGPYIPLYGAKVSMVNIACCLVRIQWTYILLINLVRSVITGKSQTSASKNRKKIP